MLLDQKIILVTGSTTGIGAAIARACARAGAKVMIHGRDQDRAKALVQELGDDRTHYVLGDLSDADFSEKVVDETVRHFGRIDGLVNNGAIAHPVTFIEDCDAKTFDAIAAINLRSPILSTRRAVKYFRQQGSGTVLSIGSINAYCGQSDLLLYAMFKGALMTMTRNLANTLGPEKIRFNQINVGWTLTENEIALKKKEGLPDDWPSKVPQAFAPFGSLLTPENVAEHAVFWLSDASYPVTGSVCEVETYPIIGRNLIGDLNL